MIEVPDELEQLAGGRSLPDLLFVTSRAALVENIGRAETTQLVQGLRDHQVLLYDKLPQHSASVSAANLVRSQLRRHDHIEGAKITVVNVYSDAAFYLKTSSSCSSAPSSTRKCNV